jgi:aspartate aminotransferase/aminotransferase
MKTWLAERTSHVDSSGIRKVFDLAAKLPNPINLSIGQPDFPVPDVVKQAAIDAILGDKNGYGLTQGLPALRERLQTEVDERWGHADRRVLITSGTSGALNLALMTMVNPGDEVIMFDPYFVMYPALTKLVGGVPVVINTYPDFAIDLDKVEQAITPRTKLILLNSPGNPTGRVATPEEARGLAELAARHNVALISDEIYSRFSFDAPLASPAEWNDRTIVIDGFSKSHAVTGWRIGFIHGPAEVIDKMTMLQQYSFVCAPHPLQYGALAALDLDMADQVATYQARRDRIVAGLQAAGYELEVPGGAFYVFPKLPWGTGQEFVTKAIEHELLVIPGTIFSQQDTHFRISYAASEETIERGIKVLTGLAQI